MDEQSLILMTTKELTDLLNEIREKYSSFPKDSKEAREKKIEMDLIIRAIVTKRN